MVDYYAILEVPQNATEEQIKKKYRELALKYHPDKAGPSGAARFKEVNAAYEVLSDPNKRTVYDRYGETGLDAMDNPMANSAVSMVGASTAACVVMFIVFIVVAMVLIFLAFLAAYVDGHLSNFNYVKVFSPLFVVDIIVGIPLLVVAVVSGVSCQIGPMNVLLASLCAVVLTICVPIAKDRNESRSSDFLKWRVWLIPGYLLTFFLFLGVVMLKFPTQERRQKYLAHGLRRMVSYMPFSFALKLLEVFCVAVFFALVACRADEVITTNYFVVIGVPCFACGGLMFIDAFFIQLFHNFYTIPAEQVHQANNVNEDPSPAPAAAADAAGSGEFSGSTPGNATDANNNNTTNNNSNTSASQTNNTNTNNNNNNNTANTAAGEGEEIVTCYHIGRVICQVVGLTIWIALCCATAGMVCTRLNYYWDHGTYDGTFPLAKALIPMFVMVGCVVLVVLLMLLGLCCGMLLMGPAMPEEEEERPETRVPPTPPHNEAEAANDDGNQQEQAAENSEHSTTAPGAVNPEHCPDNKEEAPPRPTEDVSDID